MNASIYMESRPDKTGRNSLFFYINGMGKRSKIFSGIKVLPQNWKQNRIHKNEPNFDLLNTLLQTKFNILSRIISEAKLKNLNVSPNDIKNAYLSNFEKKEEQNIVGDHRLIPFMENYKKTYESIHKVSTLRALNQVKAQIEKYKPESTFEEINHLWLIGFCNHLIKEDMSDSTIKHRHLKTIKFLSKEAERSGIKINPEIYRFTWKSMAQTPFCASWEEVEKIKGITDLINKNLEIVRDTFILSCYTGLRDSDLRNISANNIVKQGVQTMLRVVMVKTDFDYSIPLSKEVITILEKYQFKLPKIAQQKYNLYIKQVARIVVKGKSNKVRSSGNKKTTTEIERHMLFSSHTGRRTFGRRFLDMGGSLIVLSKIFGHSNTETTLKYIGYQPQEVVSEFQKVFG